MSGANLRSPSLSIVANTTPTKGNSAMTETAPRNPGRSMTFEAWAERRGLDHATAMQAVLDGRLVTYSVGGQRFVTEESDLAFLEAAEAEQAEADLEAA